MLRIVDDRGTPHRLCDPEDLVALSWPLSKDLTSTTRDRERVVVASAMTATGVGIVVQNGVSNPVVVMTATVVGLVPWLCVALFYGLTATKRRACARRAITYCLRCATCPCCGYNLRALARESDGCCVCPECGAAWRVPE